MKLKMIKGWPILAFLGGMLMFGSAHAAVPRTISHQGYLKTSSGAPASGAKQMTFSLYEVETDGTPVWSEMQTVQVQNGIYAAALGAVNPLDPALIAGDLWLGVAVGGDAEMTPRQKLQSVPFALKAALVPDNSITDSKLSGVIDASRIAEIAQLQTVVTQLEEKLDELNSIPEVNIKAPVSLWSLALGAVDLIGTATDADSGHAGNLAIQWSFDTVPEGSSAFFSDASGFTTSFLPDMPGDYVVRLTATDPLGASATVTHTVQAVEYRFVDNGDGTVLDRKTGLTWLKDVGCSAIRSHESDVASNVANLSSEVCGLTDGSVPGDWRLPTMEEMQALMDPRFSPQLSNSAGDGPWREGDPFSGLDTFYYTGTRSASTNMLISVDIYSGATDDAYTSWGYAFPILGQ